MSDASRSEWNRMCISKFAVPANALVRSNTRNSTEALRALCKKPIEQVPQITHLWGLNPSVSGSWVHYFSLHGRQQWGTKSGISISNLWSCFCLPVHQPYIDFANERKNCLFYSVYLLWLLYLVTTMATKSGISISNLWSAYYLPIHQPLQMKEKTVSFTQSNYCGYCISLYHIVSSRVVFFLYINDTQNTLYCTIVIKSVNFARSNEWGNYDNHV